MSSSIQTNNKFSYFKISLYMNSSIQTKNKFSYFKLHVCIKKGKNN